MATVLKLLQVQENEDSMTLIAQVILSGNYTNPGGDNIDLTQLIGVSSPNGRVFLASAPCIAAQLTSGNGFIISCVPGASLALNAFFAYSAVNVQQASGAYPANLLNDFITGTFTFAKLL